MKPQNFQLEPAQDKSEYQTSAELLSVIEQLQDRAYTASQLTGYLTFLGYEARYIRRGKKVVKAWNCTVSATELCSAKATESDCWIPGYSVEGRTTMTLQPGQLYKHWKHDSATAQFVEVIARYLGPAEHGQLRLLGPDGSVYLWFPELTMNYDF